MQKSDYSLLADGAEVIRNAMPMEDILALRTHCTQAVESYRLKPGQKDSAAAPVSPTEPVFLKAIQYGASLLQERGYSDVRFLAGALIPKWNGEGRRGFHVDGFLWEDSADAWREVPPQVGLLFYLDDAMANTGALIIVPHSHRREVIGHHLYWETWDSHPHEVQLEAKAGDAVLLDPRCMHAVTANTETPLRMCLTLWFLIDFEKLEGRTRATTMLSIPPDFKPLLGPLCPEYGGPEKYFPHCKKPQFPITLSRIQALRNGRTDEQIVGTAAQPGDDFIKQFETYSYLFGIGAAKAPRRILEIGTRYAYGIIALAKGTMWAGVTPEVIAVDCEADGIASNAIAIENVKRETGLDLYLINANTQNVADTNAKINGRGTMDIVVIDGDHSPQGILNEISIAMMWAKPNALLLIDDCDVPHVRAAAGALALDLGITPLDIPTQHSLCVIDLKKRSKYNGRN